MFEKQRDAFFLLLQSSCWMVISTCRAMITLVTVYDTKVRSFLSSLDRIRAGKYCRNGSCLSVRDNNFLEIPKRFFLFYKHSMLCTTHTCRYPQISGTRLILNTVYDCSLFRQNALERTLVQQWTNTHELMSTAALVFQEQRTSYPSPCINFFPLPK